MSSAATIQLDLSPNVVLQAIQQMDDDSFDDFFQQIKSIRNQRGGTVGESVEVELLQTIVGASLPPVEHARLLELGYKLEEEVITSDEQSELEQLTNKSETLNVERLKAVRDLAELRRKSFHEMMEDLGLLNTYA